MEIEWCVGVKIGIDEHAYEDQKFYKSLRNLNLYLQSKNYNYDYTNTKYWDDEHPLTIVCNLHGEFQELPKNIINNKIPCKECAKTVKEYSYKNKFYTLEAFKQACIEANGDRFDYSKIEFNGFNRCFYPSCKEHGTITVKKPHTHLTYTTCAKCRGTKSRYTQEDFVKKAKELHGNKYDYSNSIYTSSREEITIYCNYCKQEFTHKQASYHLQGNGCNLCSLAGFDSSKPGILYYLSIDDGTAYKIGITNKSVKERYTPSDLKRIKIIKEWKFSFGNDARIREQEIIQTFKYAKYNGDISLESCTHKEMFNYDVLLLDN